MSRYQKMKIIKNVRLASQIFTLVKFVITTLISGQGSKIINWFPDHEVNSSEQRELGKVYCNIKNTLYFTILPMRGGFVTWPIYMCVVKLKSCKVTSTSFTKTLDD